MMNGFSNLGLNGDLLRAIPSVVVWKDVDSTYIAASQKAVDLTKYPSMDKMLGTKDADLPGALSEFSPIFVEQDQSVMRNKAPLEYLDIHAYPNSTEKQVFFTTKSPVLDAMGDCIGTCCHLEDLTHISLQRVAFHLLKLQQKSHEVMYFSSDSLTSRESEILFYLLYGKNSREISQILTRSKRTIDYFINNLKEKFNAGSKSQLIEAAIQAGHLSVLPKTLLNQNLSILLSL